MLMTEKNEKPAAAAKTAKPVGKKASKGVNKSAEIRKIAQSKGGKVRPKDVIAELKAKGITVSSPQVSMVLKRMGFRRRRRATAKAARVEVRQQIKALVGGRTSGPVTVDDLLVARRMADQLGGTDRAMAALAALKRLD
jgi:hypothetical protein